MDYQCECGEEFDIFDQFSTNYFTDLDENAEGESCLCAFYDIKCPRCGRVYQVKEEYEFKGASVVAR